MTTSAARRARRLSELQQIESKLAASASLAAVGDLVARASLTLFPSDGLDALLCAGGARRVALV